MYVCCCPRSIVDNSELPKKTKIEHFLARWHAFRTRLNDVNALIRPVARLGARPCWVSRPGTPVLVLALAISVSAALAQSGLRLTGHVEDEAGAAVPRMTVVVTPVDPAGNPSGGPVLRAKTSKAGKFTFGFVKPGDYLLSIESDGLQPKTAAVRMRDENRKPVYTPDGPVEDRSGPIDPARPVVGLGIPGEAYVVEVDLVVGEPVAAAASGASSLDIGAQLVASNLGAEVEEILAQLEAGQYEFVAVEVSKLIAVNPELAPLHYLYGYTQVKLGRLPEAETSLREAIRLSPDIAGASGLLGQILGQQGKFEEAVPALRHELTLADSSIPRASLLLSLGQALLEVDKVDEAVTALEEAQRLDPNSDLTRVQLVDAYTRSGNSEGAERILSEGLDPESAAVLHFNLAANMLRQERWDEGAKHMRQALADNPSLTDAHKYLAQAYLAKGDQPTAVAEFKAYVEAAPDAADAGQIRQIIEALEKAIAQK